MRAEIEYALAWAWLVPSHGTTAVSAVGFSDHEAAVLHASIAAGQEVGETEGAGVLIVNADHPAAETALHRSAWGSTFSVAAVGTGRSIRRWRRLLAREFPHTREFGLIPASVPRIVVPLGDVRRASAALNLHRPGRTMARWGVAAASVLVRFGIRWPLRGRVLYIATRDANALPIGAERCGFRGNGTDVEFALYLGTPEPGRKTVILPLSSGAPEVIIKVAGTPESRRMLQREIDALSTLAEMGIADQVPRCVRVHHGADMLVLYQQYRARRRCSGALLERAAVSFLGRLAKMHCRRIRLEDDLGALPVARGNGAGPAAAMLALLQRHGASGAHVFRHFTHGDFAPWNCAWTDAGFFAFDWERAHDQGLAFEDAFYYRIAPAKLMGTRLSAEEIVHSAIALAVQVARTSGLENADPRLHFGLWLHAQHAAEPTPFHEALLAALARTWSRNDA